MNSTFKIAIIGGGTASWLTANLLAKRWQDKPVEIHVIDAPDIGAIGVGEGSTPSLKRFFDMMELEDKDWMPQCNATYKVNIRFSDWSPQSGKTSYGHPFFGQVDVHTENAFIKNCLNRRHGYETETQPEKFFLNGILARDAKTPIAPAHFPFRMEYGFHFDSHLMGHFLSELAQKQGVHLIEEKVTAFHRNDQGNVAAALTDQGRRISADFFIDCTGFRSLLLGQTLGAAFEHFDAHLFNDSALTIAMDAANPLPTETSAIAMENGWMWKIPLTNRTGCGYVFSSAFTSPENAELEMRAKLNLQDPAINVNHLKMKVGQLKEHWKNNCLAIGLSQGFVEPLEATALHLVLTTVEQFMKALESGHFTHQNRDKFNSFMTGTFHSVRDYIIAHYKLNTRYDTEYWRANRDNTNTPEALTRLLSAWDNKRDMARELQQIYRFNNFNALSWHCLLSGYGYFPPLVAQQRSDVDFYKSQNIAAFLDGCSLNFNSTTT